LHERHWNEVFLLVASLLQSSDRFMDEMIDSRNSLIKGNSQLTDMYNRSCDKVIESELSIKNGYVGQIVYITLFSAFILAETNSYSIKSNKNNNFGIMRSTTKTYNLIQSLADTLQMPSLLDITNVIDPFVTFNTETSAISLNLAIRTIDLSSLLQSSQELTKRLNSKIGFDYGLYYTWALAKKIAKSRQNSNQQRAFISAYPKLIELCKQATNENHATYLASLLSPLKGNSSHSVWQHFVEQLAAYMKKYRQLHTDLSLQPDDITALNDYLYASELLIRCLDLCYLDNRENILESMALPLKSR
ncbi:MAG: hypothetical protein AAF639_43430, partial [Chloroflexota bacterium]